MPFDDRTRIVVGDRGARLLAASKVCVFGLGGVGAAAAIDLVRAGVGSVAVFDFDRVEESNLNRLYFGYSGQVGRPKVEAFADFARQVNPGVVIEAFGTLVRGANAADSIPPGCAFHLDCIDTLNSKVNLMAALARAGHLFASSMGTAGRLAPERLRIGPLWEAKGCPLAAEVRKRLRRLGFGPLRESLSELGGPGVSMPESFECVWSDEPPAAPAAPPHGLEPGTVVSGARIRAVQGSAPFVPQAAGHLLASLAVRRILGAW